MLSLKRGIFHALVYADIFQYPMTVQEVLRWIPTEKPIAKRTIQKAVQQLVHEESISFTAPFLVLKKNTPNIGLHAERLVHSQKKWKNAYCVAKILRCIPTILFVGVTGSLAMNNAGAEDDIDFCIVAAKGTVWITRFLTTITVELVAKRRHPGSINIQDTICLNMFLSEDSLKTEKAEQDVYIAHEVIQMVPMWERKGIEKRFLSVNSWVKKYYYHAYQERLALRVQRVKRKPFWEKVLRFLEGPVRTIQLRYMAKRRTTEVVTKQIIRFHPKDMRHFVLFTLDKKLHRI